MIGPLIDSEWVRVSVRGEGGEEVNIVEVREATPKKVMTRVGTRKLERGIQRGRDVQKGGQTNE